MLVISLAGNSFDTATNGVITEGYPSDEIASFIENSTYKGILKNNPYCLTLDCRCSASNIDYVVICFDSQGKALKSFNSILNFQRIVLDEFQYVIQIPSENK